MKSSSSALPIMLVGGCVIFVIVGCMIAFMLFVQQEPKAQPWAKPVMPKFQNPEIVGAATAIYNVSSNCPDLVKFYNADGEGGKILLQYDSELTAQKARTAPRGPTKAQRRLLATTWMVAFSGAFLRALEQCPRQSSMIFWLQDGPHKYEIGPSVDSIRAQGYDEFIKYIIDRASEAAA